MALNAIPYSTLASVGVGPQIHTTIKPMVTGPSRLRLGVGEQSFMMGLSIIQIIVGFVCIVVHAIQMSRTYYYYVIVSQSPSIIFGVLFLASGLVGAVAAKKNNPGLIVGTLVLSIISTIFVWGTLSLAVFGLMFLNGSCLYGDCGLGTDLAANYYILLVGAVVEFIVALWSAILCCRGLCRGWCTEVHEDCLQVMALQSGGIVAQQPWGHNYDARNASTNENALGLTQSAKN